MKTPATIDEYIATFPAEARARLEQVRQAIRKAVPKAEEGISYRIPTYRLDGRYLIYFAGFKGSHRRVPGARRRSSARRGDRALRLRQGDAQVPARRTATAGADRTRRQGEGKGGEGAAMTSIVSGAAARATRREWIGLAVIALPCMVYAMDLTVLNLALPAHQRGAASRRASQLLWIVDIYGFLVAGFLITMGTLGDRIGRRKLLLIGAAAFARRVADRGVLDAAPRC